MDLVQQFAHAFRGQPWHGRSSAEIIEACDPAKVYQHWIPGAHSIAELVVHLTGWTEEALQRLDGKEAGDPDRGDWPEIMVSDEQGWKTIVDDYRNAYVRLMERIKRFTADEWGRKTIDNREGLNEGAADTYAELINGIVQHLAYHSGQIALLQKF